MIIREPDLSVTPEEFLRRMHDFRKEANSAKDWVFREEYIDKRFLEPHYILKFRRNTGDRGDDLGDQSLFGSPFPHIRGICMTREAKSPGGTYWKEISHKNLLHRLDHFKAMYMGDYLRPSGFRGELYRPRERHEIFHEKRFLYQIQSPNDDLVAIGSKMFAGLRGGAVCGTVFDEEGAGLDDVTVQLQVKDKNLTRITRDGGLFWFSRVPSGKAKITVKDRSCIVRALQFEEFGSLKGWLVDEDGNPVGGVGVEFQAPDQEVFGSVTDGSGKFDTGPIPAYPAKAPLLDRFPYIMSLPSFLFSMAKDIKVDDGALGGLLKNSAGEAMTGRKIILTKSGTMVAEKTSDAQGVFLFSGLRGGRYQLQVPGSRIFVMPLAGGAIEGELQGAPLTMEIFTGESLIAKEKSDLEGRFSFNNVAPGSYQLFRKRETG